MTVVHFFLQYECSPENGVTVSVFGRRHMCQFDGQEVRVHTYTQFLASVCKASPDCLFPPAAN